MTAFKFAPTFADHGRIVTSRQKACDRCRRRKTRCDGSQPCRLCTKVATGCTYLIPLQRVGRKPRRVPPQPPAREGTSLSCPSAAEPHFGEREVDSFPVSIDESPRDQVQDSFPDEQHLEKAGTVPESSPTWSGVAPGIPWSPAASVPLISPSGTSAIRFTTASRNIPTKSFVPYIQLFLQRLYPILPVFDESYLSRILKDNLRLELQPDTENRRDLYQSYPLLCAISATLAITLNIESQQDLDEALSISAASPKGISVAELAFARYVPVDHFMREALRVRQLWDYMEDPTEETLMTSFFLFAYYGNLDQSRKAWYYLREAVGFALALGLDDRSTYAGLSIAAAQRKRRIFWLLFVTERAYALQHRSGVMLKPTIDLPRVLDGNDIQVMHGFVEMVKLFVSVDSDFVSAWTLASLESTSESVDPGPANLRLVSNSSLDHPVTTTPCESQRLNLLITRIWLSILQWQYQNRITAASATAPTLSPTLQLARQQHHSARLTDRFTPFRASHQLLESIVGANNHRQSLESHGIGMEQKIFDIASCLASVLEDSAASLTGETLSVGHNYLHGIMQQLVRFRNRESRYLRRLVGQASRSILAGLDPVGLGGARPWWEREAEEMGYGGNKDVLRKGSLWL